MAKTVFVSHKIEERSYAAFVKKEIQDIVGRANFKPARAGEIDIVVAELTSNLIKHAQGGELLYQLYWEDDSSVFELICLDRGPGMSNVAHLMRDGVSTTNTLGGGMGAVKRLSDVCHIYSLPEWGTIIYCRFVSASAGTPKLIRSDLSVDVLGLPKPGEMVCGDGYSIKNIPGKSILLLGDGLGHGVFAHEAVQTAVRAFQQCPAEEPVPILKYIHEAVRRTRGLVATVAVLDHIKKDWEICGVGNINTRLYELSTFRSFMPYNGILGLNLPGTMKSHHWPAVSNQQIIMYSDGINARWDLAKYPGLLKAHSLVQAAVLYKDHCRGTDDATVLVGKAYTLKP